MTRNDTRKRVLVVVDRAITDPDSVPASVFMAEARADDVRVITPALTSRLEWLTGDDARATDSAAVRLESILARLREQGVQADGTVGDESPLTAIHDALAEFSADEIIITIAHDRDVHWQEHGLADKIRSRYTQPLTEVLVNPDGTASIRPAAKHPTRADRPPSTP